MPVFGLSCCFINVICKAYLLTFIYGKPPINELDLHGDFIIQIICKSKVLVPFCIMLDEVKDKCNAGAVISIFKMLLFLE